MSAELKCPVGVRAGSGALIMSVDGGKRNKQHTPADICLFLLSPSLVPLLSPYSTGGGVRTPDPLPRARAEVILYGGQGDIAH